MPLYKLACFDNPDSLDLRMATRPAHLAYAGENLAQVKMAGALLDDAGDMAGSLFIMDVPDRAAVEAFNAADPYQTAGLFGRVEIRGFRVSIGTV
jgi:uncharacterized protein YciI